MSFNNWDPTQGDFKKYNASQDRKVINKKFKTTKYIRLILLLIILVLLFLSFYHF